MSKDDILRKNAFKGAQNIRKGNKKVYIYVGKGNKKVYIYVGKGKTCCLERSPKT